MAPHGNATVMYNGGAVGYNGGAVGYNGGAVEYHGDAVVYHGDAVVYHGGAVVYHGDAVVYHGGAVEYHGDAPRTTPPPFKCLGTPPPLQRGGGCYSAGIPNGRGKTEDALTCCTPSARVTVRKRLGNSGAL